MNEPIEAEARPLAIREEVTPPLATPAISPAEAKDAMRQYLELCEAVLDASDYQEFTQKKKVGNQWVTEQKKFKKKSAVKKLQTFFGVEVCIKDAQLDDLGDGHFGFRVIATARARNGRVVEATGACSTQEERFDLGDDVEEWKRRKALARAYHDVLSTAETRATNRAVMNCIGVGGGEVTADEVQRDRAPRREPQAAPVAQPRPAADPAPLRWEAKARVNKLGWNREKYEEFLVHIFGADRFKDADKPTSKVLNRAELEQLNGKLVAQIRLQERAAK